jgi:tetratricopeptide (TPR) repeat protein
VSDSLFEQYKAALRRGHMAALAGELEDALAAYDAAARLVPERALPLASRGTVLHRLDRWEEAARAFDRALQLAPDDETTLRARANARDERGLRSGAASDFERLAFVLDVAGRGSPAAKAARRAADLEPTAARAALAERLEAAVAQLGDVQVEADGGIPGRTELPPTLDRSPDGMPTGAAMHDDPWSAALDARRLAGLNDEAAAGEQATDPAPAHAAETAAASTPDATQTDAPDDVAGTDDGGATEDVARIEHVAATDGAAEVAGDAEPSPGTWPGIDLPSPPPPPIEGPPPEPEDLLAEAALVLESGEVDAARDLMLTAIRVHRDAGRIDAALDIALNVLSIAPGDPRVHLAIANLQLDRGWTAVATEKIELLVRLTSLTGDVQSEADVHGLASERLRDEPAPTTAGR